MENSICPKAVAVTRPGAALRSSVFALVALVLGACGDSTGPVDLRGVSLIAPETIHFTTALPGGYRQIVVPVKITNSTSKVINRAWCSESLERFDLASWKNVWSPICLASLSDGPILPGASQTVSITIADTPAQYAGWRFTDPQNAYRLVLIVYAGGDDGTSAISGPIRTNAFQVVP